VNVQRPKSPKGYAGTEKPWFATSLINVASATMKVLFRELEHNVPKMVVITKPDFHNVCMVYNCKTASEFLNQELRRRTSSNPRYSLRSFAKNLGLSPGALSEVLNGKRPLSAKAVPKIAKAVGLNRSESEHLLEIIEDEKSLGLRKLTQRHTQLSERGQKVLDQKVFALVSEWYHFAILNLLETADFTWDSQWIATRLNISVIQAKLAMQLLTELNLIVKRNGKIESTEHWISSENEIPSAAIKEYHKQILEKAINSLYSQSITERDVSGVGFAVDPERLKDLKTEIEEFQSRVVEKYSKGRKTEVYQLEMVLFKLTQGDAK
jgi:uncharacterized protein (TIGR02147 family)